MSEKRGQVTIFIIIALVILAGIIVYIIFNNQINKRILPVQNQVLSGEVEQVKQNVEDCLITSAEGAVFLNSFNSGYYNLENEIYYFEGDKPTVPSKEDLEREFSFGINDFFKDCINFSLLQTQPRYSLDEITSSVSLSEDSAKIKLNFPIVVLFNDSSVKLEKFEKEYNTDYFFLYEVSQEITDEQAKHPQEFCFSCLDEISENYGVSVKVTESEDEKYYYINYFVSMKNKLNSTEPVYSFSHRLNLINE